MKKRFHFIFLEEAEKFYNKLNLKAKNKLTLIFDLINYTNNTKYFKKIDHDIWEIRMRYQNTQYRFFAFMDLTENKKTLILLTHGIIKKTQKIPLKEIAKAKKIRDHYLKSKRK